MKVKLLVVLFLALTFSQRSEAEQLVHAGVSAGLNAAFYTVFTGAMGRGVNERLPCLIGSSALTMLVGITSEVNDSVTNRTPTLDTHDLAMDAIGIGVSSLLIYVIDIHGQKDKKTTLGFDGQRLTIGWRF